MGRYPAPFPAKITGVLAAIAGLVGASAAHADDVSDLKAQINALQSKVEQMEKSQAQPAPAAQGLTSGGAPGSFKLPGSDTTVTLGGYVKLDAIVSSRSAGANTPADQAMLPQLLPLGPQPNEEKQVTMHARQTRFSVKTSTPSAYGDVVAFLEGDFFGALDTQTSSNGSGLRMRHAYGQIGGLLAGQTWSNFMNEAAMAETLDFGGPVGMIFGRQAQIRWTQPFAGGDWSVSAENPESVLALPGQAGKGTTFSADDDRSPDLTARVRFGMGGGKYSVQALVRNIRADSAASPAVRDNKTGGAIGFNGIVPTFGKDDLRFQLNAGNVIGRYQEMGFYPDGYISAAGKIELADTVSGYVAYRHFWTDALRSSLVLSAATTKTPTAADGGINRRSQSAHLNLIWSPVKNVNLGAEYIYAKRVVADGRFGNLNRLQLSAQFGF